MAILVIADHDNSTLAASTLNTLGAAALIGGEIDLLVMGADCAAVTAQAAAIPAVRRVLCADSPQYAQPVAEDLSPLVQRCTEGYSHLLASNTTFAKNLMPRVAAMLDLPQISEISAVVDADTFERPIYAGNAIATVRSADALKVITVRSTRFDAVEATGGDAETLMLDAPGAQSRARFVSRTEAKSEGPELATAHTIISGGRGMGNGENFALLEAVASKVGAAVGASRAAVDAGFVPNDYQVGQTGKVVAPELYIAVGISGAIQHLAGMKDSKTIVAINSDPDAPIFQVADYGIVGDLFEVLPALEAAL